MAPLAVFAVDAALPTYAGAAVNCSASFPQGEPADATSNTLSVEVVLRCDAFPATTTEAVWQVQLTSGRYLVVQMASGPLAYLSTAIQNPLVLDLRPEDRGGGECANGLQPVAGFVLPCTDTSSAVHTSGLPVCWEAGSACSGYSMVVTAWVNTNAGFLSPNSLTEFTTGAHTAAACNAAHTCGTTSLYTPNYGQDPVGLLSAAMLLTGPGMVSVALAFLGVAVAAVMTRALVRLIRRRSV
jgi:hypothetical protein